MAHINPYEATGTVAYLISVLVVATDEPVLLSQSRCEVCTVLDVVCHPISLLCEACGRLLVLTSLLREGGVPG